MSSDEDGVIPVTPFVAGGIAQFDCLVTNGTGVTATLYGFVDWNFDGDFDDADETSSVGVADGSFNAPVSLFFNVPVTADTVNRVGSRFRLSTVPVLGATGWAPDGEVEDYLLDLVTTPVNLDFGDLPDVSAGTSAGDFSGGGLPDYQTKLADDGPRHVIVPGLAFADDYSGLPTPVHVDAEPDALQSPDAEGDNLGGDNDEGGLQIALVRQVVSGGPIPTSPVTLELSFLGSLGMLNSTGTDANVKVWVDLNNDGDFDDFGEEATVATPVVPGDNSQHTLEFTFDYVELVTGQCRFDNESRYFPIRARVTTDAGFGSTGFASDGEVEDHLTEIRISTSDFCTSSDDVGSDLRPSGIALSGGILPLEAQHYVPQPYQNGAASFEWRLNGVLLSGVPPVLTPSQVDDLKNGAKLFVKVGYADGSSITLQPDIPFLTSTPLLAKLAGSSLPPEQKLPHLDPDLDGVPTIVELAQGTAFDDGSERPLTFEMMAPDGSTSEPHLQQTFLRLMGGTQVGPDYVAEGIAYRATGSSDLGLWGSSEVESVPNPPGLPTPPAGFEWVTFRLKASSSVQTEGFLQLRMGVAP